MNGPFFYFAYGSNLCPVQMSERCPGSTAVGIATLEGYRLDFPRRASRWGGGGVAGCTEAPGKRVEGVLYRLSALHLEWLDGYEGVAEGCYRRAAVDVLLDTGEMRRAICYEAHRQDGAPFPPGEAYLATMIRGATHHGLSEAWIAMLKGWRAAGEPA